MHTIKLNYTTECQSKLRYETGKPMQTLKTLIITLTTFYPVYMHSPQQYSYIYFPELASLQTLKPHHTYNILPSVYAFPTAVLVHILS